MIELLEFAERQQRRIETMWTAQVGWIVGLLTCIAGALLGQSDLIGEPYKHYVTIAFIVGTAASGYMVQRPAPKPESVPVPVEKV